MKFMYNQYSIILCVYTTVLFIVISIGAHISVVTHPTVNGQNRFTHRKTLFHNIQLL